MATKKKKILIMTATGAYNLGDELILKEELQFLQSHYGEYAEFKIFTYDEKSAFIHDPEVPFVNYFPNDVFRKFFQNIGYFIKNIWLISRADVIIIGGGGLIFDNEPGVSFGLLIFQWWFRTKIARVFGTTIVYLGISLEVKNTKNKMKLSKIFYPWDFIIVRDTHSLELLQALEIPSSQIPDIAFLHEPQVMQKPERKRVGISVRGGFLGDGEESIPHIYSYLLEHGYDPVFLVHTTSGDEQQNDLLFIKRIMAGMTYNITGTIEQTMKVYPTLHAVIGMRYHAGVLACVHDIPCIMVSYGPKTEELVNLLSIKELTLFLGDVSFDNFEKMWHTLEANYDTYATRMRDRHQKIRSDLMKMLQNL